MNFLGDKVVAFPGRKPQQIGFTREELTRILDLYGRMVAAGQWRDYAMDFTRDAAVFAAFRNRSVAILAASARADCSAWMFSITGLVAGSEKYCLKKCSNL